MDTIGGPPAGDRPGYLSLDYAASFAHVGLPLQLLSAGGWLLKRPIMGWSDSDATGCYPLLCCADWAELADDLAQLDDELVSVTAVADPFGDHGALPGLTAAFQHLVRPFKEHFVIDLSQSPRRFISETHRRHAQRALAAVQVDYVAEPTTAIDDWSRLYDNLITRHRILGPAQFSRDSFERQLAVPGIVVLRAAEHGETVGMTLWYRIGERAYYHLGAYSERGYALHASYALFRVAIDLFGDEGLSWLGLGAGAGIREARDGLTRFKRGWATGTRTAFLCGRIGNPRRYEELASARGKADDFFPAYRATEWVTKERTSQQAHAQSCTNTD